VPSLQQLVASFFFLDCFGSDDEEFNSPKSILIYPVKNINIGKQQGEPAKAEVPCYDFSFI
jgi:hypothetical protein